MEKRFADSSKEDYLKTILVIMAEKEKCRVIDIARYLNVTKASASIAVKKLENAELIMKENNNLWLTEQGKEIAEQIYEKGSFLEEWLIKMGIDEETAKEDACAIEHVLSEKTYKKMKEYVNSKKDE
ncbi:MAG: metal-dependent transcriptional regulator [Lachnospiraceae bacterium]|nr:metal-dependent transcriptional regulator [Lachnospiraceae bacterium]